MVTPTNEIEPGPQEECDVGIGIVTFVQIQFLGERGSIVFGVEKFAKDALGTASNDDTEGERWVR